MRSLFGLFVFSLFLGVPQVVQAQQAAPSPGPKESTTAPASASDPPERIIRKNVAFIRFVCTKGNENYDVRATGFWVAYPDARLKDTVFSYLVTNRHVAECWDETRAPMAVRSVWLRENMKNGLSSEQFLSSTGNVDWIFPSDDSVDLAVLPLALDPQSVDFLAMTTSSFLGEEPIYEGDKIMFSGFFYQFPGVKRVEPIIREGIIAMIPDEDLETTTGKPGKVYLGDVHIFGGNSGSPVFVDVGGLRGGGLALGYSYRLLGVVSGMFYEDTDLSLHVTTTIRGTTHGNSGIAMIVPAKYLKDLLEDPRLKALRDAEVARVQHQSRSGAGAK